MSLRLSCSVAQWSLRPGGLVVPSRQRLEERPLEDLAEVAGVRDGVVLDETEEVRARRGQGSAHVILRQPVQLPDERFTQRR